MRKVLLSAALGLCLCGGLMAQTASSKKNSMSQDQGTTYYFVIAASASTVKDLGNGTYELTLINVNKNVVQMQDRPGRRAAFITYEQFFKLWDKGPNSFQSDKPNVGMVAVQATGKKNKNAAPFDKTMTIVKREYNKDMATVTFTVRPMIDGDTLTNPGETISSFGETLFVVDGWGLPV